MSQQHIPPAQTMVGKVALVTGSSAGIGAAAAIELSRRGANLAIHYRSEKEKKAALATQARLSPSTKSIIVETDLSTLEGPAMLVNAVVTEFGHIDYLVNNAAAFAPAVTLVDINVKDLEIAFAVNSRAVLLVTQEALKHFSKKDCRIVNITSTNAMDPVFGTTVYAGTKAMVDSFTRSWAKELPRDYGCTVNSVAPGPIATENLLAAPAKFLDKAQKDASATPVAPRLGKPEELGWTIATLCEPQASWLNGLRINCNGGLTLW
ncbi:3-oxoacyl-reductase [Cadophora sp. DSE1049]|nr:3-oxoacyl-reductase [Cadophora sp. DSE1049]